MTVYLGFVPSTEHLQSGHPESPERMGAIMELVDSTGIRSKVSEVDIIRGNTEQVALAHSEQLIHKVREASLQGGGHLDADTYSTADSYASALDAVGTTAHLVDLVMQSESARGVALVRPPGHHAEGNRVGGFCLFNNAAIAARQAQQIHGAERVLIVDIDVHHGNGTQAIFYDDPTVLYVSAHQYGYFFYPGTGAMDEMGAGPGYGYTLNIPFPPGAGDHWYLAAMKEIVGPKVKLFSPDLILVSAGFDAHWIDPLASERLTLEGYSNLIRILLDLANEHCGGKIVVVLEGGYHLTALSHGVINAICHLLDLEEMSDPLGPSPQPEQDMTNVLSKLRNLHLLN